MSPSAAPPSLKGITSTNDDPSLCAICSDPFPKGMYTIISMMNYCCGKRTCASCRDLVLKITGRSCRCSLCNKPNIEGDSLGVLKKHAKKGAPWAQFSLGIEFLRGRYVPKSHFDAVRWFRKAAARGHPGAHWTLGGEYLTGNGCAKDLSQARTHAEKALALDANLVDETRGLLSLIGGAYVNMNTEQANQEAKEILMPLAKAGIANAQQNLGKAFINEDDALAAEKWFVSAALQQNGPVDSAYYAMLCCKILGKFAQSRYWLEAATKRKDEFHAKIIEQRTAGMEQTWADYRELRDECGGCGSALDGKMRKICKQCKTFCYCSRECQKLHWNFQGEGGHRDDCMGVLDLKEKMKSVRAAEKK